MERPPPAEDGAAVAPLVVPLVTPLAGRFLEPLASKSQSLLAALSSNRRVNSVPVQGEPSHAFPGAFRPSIRPSRVRQRTRQRAPGRPIWRVAEGIGRTAGEGSANGARNAKYYVELGSIKGL